MAFKEIKNQVEIDTITTITVSESPYTPTSTDDIIRCDCSGGNITINLPTASGVTRKVYNIKKVDSSSNKVTIDGNGSETVEFALTQELLTQGENLTIYATGSNWEAL